MTEEGPDGAGNGARATGWSGGSTRTPPEAWAAALVAHRPPRFDPSAHRRVVVVAAHPDDETIGAGGALQSLRAADAEITVVVATDGEAAYPGLGAAARGELATRRRAELAAALRVLGLSGAPVHWLGLPDSALADHADGAAGGARAVAGRGRRLPGPVAARPAPRPPRRGARRGGGCPGHGTRLVVPDLDVGLDATRRPDRAVGPRPRRAARRHRAR